MNTNFSQSVISQRKFRASCLKGVCFLAILTIASVLPGQQAHAGYTATFGDDQSITVGAGLRTSVTGASDSAPDGHSRSADFTLDSFRFFISGSVNKYIKATFNTERTSDGSINVLDGYAQFEPMDEFNIWVGRMLPPSDRSNLDGPYYLNTWYYPGVVSQYPAKFAGRDDGATIWGKVLDKKLVYSAGIFAGHNRIAGASNQADHMLYAGRIAYNFWDPEPNPAYYESSTYYGTVDILTLAVNGMYQADGVGTAVNHGDYKSWNVDGLFEKKLGDAGTLTLEGAYYDYDTGGVLDVTPSFGGASSTDNVGGLTQGKGYLASGAYLIPGVFGWGQFQPSIRYQQFDADLTSSTVKQYDVGVNYVIKGHNARISLDYAKDEQTNTKSSDKLVLGIQIQI